MANEKLENRTGICPKCREERRFVYITREVYKCTTCREEVSDIYFKMNRLIGTRK